MKRLYTLLLTAALTIYSFAAQVDMQAHVMTDEALDAYTYYQTKQQGYYTGEYTYDIISTKTGDQLFGLLNELMGATCRLQNSSFSYNSLRDAYKRVDKDLNKSGNIIGYYDGQSMDGTWDNGNTWNREHTWPQSKGANKEIPMGYDMQSVRPASTEVNSDRGSTAYGETGTYYDPNEISISNPYYKPTNLGTYRGDAARVILYDYLVYGKVGSYQNAMYNGKAQLLDKLGKNGVFESVAVILKWHMQDPPSLTEMVRNDGAQSYQGNRNPFIDFPEIAVEILGSKVTTYTVSVSNITMWPSYRHTTSAGFIAYLIKSDGSHPEADELSVTGTNNFTYDEALGRLTIKGTTAGVKISYVGETAVESTAEDHKDAPIYDILGRRVTRMQHGQIYIREGKKFIY